jgi:hypothetical protein
MSNSVPRGGLPGLLRAALVGAARMAGNQSRAKRLVRELLDRFPALQVRVHSLIGRTGPRPLRRPHVPQDVGDLSPDTHALYQELKQHFEAMKR